MPWIDHPACSEPVSVKRWIKWKLSEWLGRISARLEWQALYPNCQMCGKPRDEGNHSGCEELPF